MKKLIPLLTIVAGLALAGCNKNSENNNGTSTSGGNAGMSAATNGPAGTNAAPAP
jgi:hypothetical protein